ncbi:hypothetical protein CEXT_160071 [Caerostris extrusa]|uniref:Uncharacterized protein n=1 Tax=Caerostris extrusa TaxID=172846 RepID=A0AAV4NGV1_CAEEX|nr:hypothetical protein CEXT_160071 [Caerostris extrusa]
MTNSDLIKNLRHICGLNCISLSVHSVFNSMSLNWEPNKETDMKYKMKLEKMNSELNSSDYFLFGRVKKSDLRSSTCSNLFFNPLSV